MCVMPTKTVLYGYAAATIAPLTETIADHNRTKRHILDTNLQLRKKVQSLEAHCDEIHSLVEELAAGHAGLQAIVNRAPPRP